MFLTSGTNEFLQVILAFYLIKVQKSSHERSWKWIFVTITALVVSTRKLFFSPVHRLFVIQNTLSIDALVPGMAKENSKIIYMFLNEMPSRCINSNTSDHLSTLVIKIVFQSLIVFLLIFLIWLNSLKSSSSSKIFLIFWSASALYLILLDFLPIRGFFSSVQRNVLNGRKVLLHTTEMC
jgi:hypothetical protein